LSHWIRFASGSDAEAADVDLQVFLSYTHDRRPLALALSDSLAANNVRVLRDEDIEAGSSVQSWISENIFESDALVLLMDRELSPWQRAEVETAASAGVQLIAVTLHDLPERFPEPTARIKEDALDSAPHIAERIVEILSTKEGQPENA
jgi:hypothetical protein